MEQNHRADELFSLASHDHRSPSRSFRCQRRLAGQLQDALNTIWGVKAKPGGGIWGFLRSRFLSFAMVGGVCFLLLVSLTLESVLKGFSRYIQGVLPGGIVIAIAVYWIFDLAVVILLFATIL